MITNFKKAFTLLEMIVVIMLVAVVTGGASRIIAMSQDAKRFQKTVRMMEQIRRKITGDERIIQSGRRFDFGFFGANNGAFPTDLDELAWFWPITDKTLYTRDAWSTGDNQYYTYTTEAGPPVMLLIRSAGSWRNPSNIDLRFRTNDYTSNLVNIFVKDVNGTLLLGINHPTASNLHIGKVTFATKSTTYEFSSTASTLSYSTSGFWYVTGIMAGPAEIGVYAANGLPAENSNADWRDSLHSAAISGMLFHETIYPTGEIGTGASRKVNLIEIRLPGSISNVSGAPYDI